ncbi:MAG: WD40 repeat domain-containing protein [Treponema sp.]|jgi:WD40 repeat protein|nr:WD40 repeat domain-containing protein [Treponema sp.]
MRMRFFFGLAGLVLVLLNALPLWAQNGGWALGNFAPGGHRGAVTALVHKGDIILSAGEDGFLGIWDAQNAAAVERFQLTPYNIIAMAGRPETDEICLVESDGLGLYRISAWNYRERKNLFTLRFRDPIGYIAYSGGGNFIIAARTGRTGLVFIDAVTGGVLQSPQSLTGAAACAATGRSERNMAVYFTSGTLSYWDLELGNETNRFEVPSYLNSPILFSNNRYLAGVNSDGLAVIHAASGNLLASDAAIPPDSLLCASGDELICLVQNPQSAEVYRFTVDRNGRLAMSGRISLSAANVPGFTLGSGYFGAIAANGGIALGTRNGNLMLAGKGGQIRGMTVNNQIRIVETAVSGSTIAFLAENNTLGFIPLDFNRFGPSTIISLEQNTAYSRVCGFDEEQSGAGQFVFWQGENTLTPPALRSPDARRQPLVLGDINFRFPVRSAASAGGKILFLDSAGNLSVISPLDAQSRPFMFFSVGLMDAGFIDRDNLILGRSAVSGNSPFLMINIKTGETVPLAYPSRAGVMVYRGASGSIYAAAVDVDKEGSGLTTSIVQLNTVSPAQSVRLVEFQGEDTQFSLAESQGNFAATIGGEGAAIYSAGGIKKFERTAGLPGRLIDGGRFFISLDVEGNIAWHESDTGKLLAIFRLYQRQWRLQTERSVLHGNLSNIPIRPQR